MSRWWLSYVLIALGCSSSNPPSSPAADAGTAPTSGTSGGGGAGRSGAGTSGARSTAQAGRGGAAGKAAGGGSMASGGAGAAAPLPDAGQLDGMDSGLPPSAAAVTCTGSERLSTYVSDPALCVYVFASDLGAARQLAFASNGDLFVSNSSQLTVLWDANADGTSGNGERATFVSEAGLNHGVVFAPDEAFVYASTATSVYRWTYARGQRSAAGARQLVVSGIPGGGHSARPLAFDSQGRLYVSVGSASNVDGAADLVLRAQIRRFSLPASLPVDGLAYASGEIVATGMRNESGIYIDAQDRLWGVENGRDNLTDADLGGDIHNDNPGEEINLVDGQGAQLYGYPYCFSEHILSGGMGPGTQWADESLPNEMRQTDAFCQNTSKVHPPAYVMPAHWAPLGIIQYTGRALPYTGDLLIGAHGSWNREPASGRVIARARLQGTTVTDLTVLVGERGGSGQLLQGTWNVRPVDVRQGPDEALYVSDDLGGRVLKIGYQR